MKVQISDAVKYIGVDDKTIDLFESQYIVPNGISYNSYVIMDEKIAVMDTVDKRKTDEWFANLEEALDGRTPDYLIIHHLEPDHASNIKALADKYPSMKLVGNAKTFSMMPQYFETLDLTDRTLTVKEGDELELGSHTLKFFMAPMVHWPEVMVSYENTEKILFSADGFGKFGALDTDEDWACEARRYYFNICGKYGAQVQALLKKAAALDIKTICPLHGPILSENLEYYINLYNTWSKYEPETDGVFIAYCSIHGNTKVAAKKLFDILQSKTDKKISIADLAREDMAECIEDAFRYSKMIVAAPSYDADVFPVMNDFLHHLKMKGYKNRKVGIIENGSWAPTAARVMNGYFESMKDITVAPTKVTIRASLKDSDTAALEQLADEILA
ncbi:MAG TPA: flavodoxin [Ruminococcus sp.]|nr:flavodoxin [Ruminococcus sp.]